jgi:hypothetical protein
MQKARQLVKVLVGTLKKGRKRTKLANLFAVKSSQISAEKSVTLIVVLVQVFNLSPANVT